MGKLKKFEKFEPNETNENLIDIERLKRYALSIMICCNGEYGLVFYNEKENHVFVCLGDSSPFDDEQLMYYMQGAIAINYESEELIKVTIENECGPPDGADWKKFNGKEFVEFDQEFWER